MPRNPNRVLGIPCLETPLQFFDQPTNGISKSLLNAKKLKSGFRHYGVSKHHYSFSSNQYLWILKSLVKMPRNWNWVLVPFDILRYRLNESPLRIFKQFYNLIGKIWRLLYLYRQTFYEYHPYSVKFNYLESNRGTDQELIIGNLKFNEIGDITISFFSLSNIAV